MTTQVMSVRKKYFLPIKNYYSFEMKENDLVRDLYSQLNLIINELKYVGLSKVGYVDIVRKIIFILPDDKYASIITIFRYLRT